MVLTMIGSLCGRDMLMNVMIRRNVNLYEHWEQQKKHIFS